MNPFRVEGPLPGLINFSIAGERGLAQSLAQSLGAGGDEASLPTPERGLSRSLSLPIEEISDHIVDHALVTELSTPYLRHRALE